MLTTIYYRFITHFNISGDRFLFLDDTVRNDIVNKVKTNLSFWLDASYLFGIFGRPMAYCKLE